MTRCIAGFFGLLLMANLAYAGLALVGNENAGTISLIDTARDEVVGEIKTGGKPRGTAIHTARKLAYVSDQPNNALLVIDLEKGGDQEDRPGRIARGRVHLARRQADRRGGRAHQQRRVHRHRDRCGRLPRQDQGRQSRARGVLARRTLRLRERRGGRQARGDRRRRAQARRSAQDRKPAARHRLHAGRCQGLRRLRARRHRLRVRRASTRSWAPSRRVRARTA